MEEPLQSARSGLRVFSVWGLRCKYGLGCMKGSSPSLLLVFGFRDYGCVWVACPMPVSVQMSHVSHS